CLPITVLQPLDVIGTATAEAAGPYTVCGATPLVLNGSANGNGQWTGGTGTFANATLVNTTYTPAASEIGTSVTLTWTTNDPDGAGPCAAATDQSTLTISTPASFVPLADLTICSSSTAPLQVNSTPATGSWSGGSGVFANENSATTVYTPGPNDVANANLILVWTTDDPDGNGPCPAITVDQPLDVIGTSTAEAGGPYEICGAEPIVLSATANGAGQWTGGVGTFSDATDVGATYTPAQSEVGITVSLTWTTEDPDGNGPCTSASDGATADISTPAVITPFTPITICSNDVAQAVAVSVPPAGSWSTNGTGSFSNTQTPQSTYTPGAGEVGNIELVWTTIDPDGANGPCDAINETLELDILQTAIADISNLY
ncbi:MAG: hypothetical protein ACKOSR_01800, partial [Flavobacteriales bacterium]